MRNTTFVTLTLTTALLLGGCATPRTDSSSAGSGTPAATASDTAPRAVTPVNIPAASARTVVLAMTGPKAVVEAKDWVAFKTEWRDTFADHAKTANISFSMVDAKPAPQNQDGTLLLVTVNDYRMVGIGARIMFGIMTGNAFVDAKVQFNNLRSGASFGEQAYNTTSSAWGGIFAKVTPQQVDSIATEVFKDLKAAR